MSPNRSNGTIMSAAVFSIRGSMSRLALPTRRLTPAGTASRMAKNCSARRGCPGRAASVWSSSPRASSRPEPADGAVGGTRLERPADVVERLRLAAPDLELHDEEDRRVAGDAHIMAGVGAVFAHGLDRAAIEVLDGG